MRRHLWRTLRGIVDRCARPGCKVQRKRRSVAARPLYHSGLTRDWTYRRPPCTGGSTADR